MLVSHRYERFNNLKKLNPHLKTLLSIGGRDVSMENVVTLLSSDENRREFIETSIAFLRRTNFDGLDLNFPYAASSEIAAVYTHNFTVLCAVSNTRNACVCIHHSCDVLNGQ